MVPLELRVTRETNLLKRGFIGEPTESVVESSKASLESRVSLHRTEEIRNGVGLEMG